MLLGAGGLFAAYKFSGDTVEPVQESRIPANKSFMPEGIGNSVETAGKKMFGRKTPNSFEEKVAFEVDSIMSRAMGVIK